MRLATPPNAHTYLPDSRPCMVLNLSLSLLHTSSHTLFFLSLSRLEFLTIFLTLLSLLPVPGSTLPSSLWLFPCSTYSLLHPGVYMNLRLTHCRWPASCDMCWKQRTEQSCIGPVALLPSRGRRRIFYTG